ncbi:MAG: hypothetical protein IJ801_06975 [Lachnospiraceae bacterium]|nr:hypothetical protein [Lachnospiraceae bacterium]
MNKMDGYQVRHIRCPLCEQYFTEFLQLLNCTLDDHAVRWEKVKCPKCEPEIYVSDTADYALLADDTDGVHVGIVLT